ncbi:MAG: DUF6064 family protein [Roseovarius sp.]|uniref:DUF6064 family protein n=2 Tax=Rhodobacterales TaxID=204455 RepID=UPI0032EC53BF
MREWLTYELSDFLLFSERVYWRLFTLENAALWPMPLLAPLALLAALTLYTRRPAGGLRLLFALLALSWFSIGSNFIMQRYAPVNWVMSHAGPVFFLQAIAFATMAFIGPPRGAAPRPANNAGYALILTGTLAYPLLALLQGRTLADAEIAGIAPDPTAVVSLGAALLTTGPWHRMAASVVPNLWLAQSALTLYVLNGPAALAPGLALVAGLVALIATARRLS